MSPNQPRDFLAQGLAELAQARRHLDYSFLQLAALPANVEEATKRWVIVWSKNRSWTPFASAWSPTPNESSEHFSILTLLFSTFPISAFDRL